MKTFITSIALMILLTAIPAAAQDITVTGKVTDTHREPVSFASVVLRSLPDSAVVAGSMTGDDGGFSLSAPEGSSYLLTVSFIGYLPHEQVCGTSTDLGDIVLADDVQMLEEAVVVAHRVEHRPNGYHINLRNDPIAKGRQATQMLSFLPGVSTDDESVQILSRTTHAIYIDGIKIQDYSELKALQASQIESVDIDYMSGVEEAADAQGGVIRIKLKKQADGGFSGYLQASAGANMYGYGGESARNIFRARTGNLSIYNTLAYVRQRYFSDNESEYLFKETGSDILSREEYRSWGGYLSDRLNLSYEINPSHSLGVSGYIHTYRNSPYTNTFYTDSDSTSQIYAPSRTDKYQGVFNYTWNINDKGGKLAVTADYLRTNNTVDQFLTPEGGPEEDHGHTFQTTDMVRVRPTLNYPAGKGMISAGADVQYVHFRDLSTTQMQPAGLHTVMTGWQPAVFAEYSGSVKNFSYEAGLRAQINWMDVTAESVHNRNLQWGILPMASLMYLINPQKGHTVALQYKRTMNDLPYSAISSFRQYSSPHSYVVGNPELVPETQDEVMLMAGFFNKLTVMAGYIHLSNPVIYMTYVDQEQPDVSYNMPENGKYNSLAVFGVEGNLKPFKWWTVKPMVSLLLQYAKTSRYTVSNQAMWKFSLSNNFSFSPTFGGTLNAYYEPESRMLDALWKPVAQVNGSLYKTFLDDRLELRLDFTLWRYGRRTIIETPVYMQSVWNRTKETRAELTLTWNFSGGKKVNVRRNADSIQDYKQITDQR